MLPFSGMSTAEARAFADLWLPAWTGNDPSHLLSFYTDDAFYADPAIPRGVQGHDALLAYFTRLLRRYPDWTWVQIGSIPLEGGFLNQWRARIPLGDGVVEIDGVCTVQLRDDLIARNVVHFDRSLLLRG